MTTFPSKSSVNSIGVFLDTMGAVRHVRARTKGDNGEKASEEKTVETAAKAVLSLLAKRPVDRSELARQLEIENGEIDKAVKYLENAEMVKKAENGKPIELTEFAADALKVFDLR
jgi:predicted Rossmann fold nucleotide-binding protein DprA/Smf involved in DNA uptake